MKIGLLYEQENKLVAIKRMIEEFVSDVRIEFFATPFETVSYIYDEVKGDIDLLMVHVSNSDDENILMAQDIQNYFPHIMMVFFSEATDCAESIFQARPLYFLKMPIRPNSLHTAIDRAIENLEEEKNQVLSVVSKGELQKVKLSTIVYIESIGRKLFIHTNNGEVSVNMTMDEILGRLPDMFEQCHRSYIVNMSKVTAIRGDEACLSNDIYVPIARSHLKDIKNKLLK